LTALRRAGTPAATYRPAWWLPGSHAQTVGARLLRSRRGVDFRRERLELPDGDFLDLDWADVAGAPPRTEPLPLVVVLHGLEGSARSTYALESYRALAREGVAAVGLNFRSCSGEPNRLPRLYHSGETGDLRFVLRVLRERFPRRPLGTLGFSLGGNVMLKYLGESPDALPAAAAAVSVPYDLAAGADYIERGWSRAYRRYLVRKLQRKVALKAAQLDGLVDLALLRRARTFREFDDAGTAPLHGFTDADDYYRRSSSKAYLPAVAVPTLLVHALDDPFLPPHALPDAAILDKSRWLSAAFVPHGGHVGFVAGPPYAPIFFAERQAARFLADALGAAGPEPPSAG